MAMVNENAGEDDFAERLLSNVADILIVLADVGSGDYSVRLQTDLPDDHALGALYAGINEMIDSLATAQDRSNSYRQELEEKLATIDVQRAAIRELSTPVMEVWDGVLCLPVVGVLDTGRSAEMTETLLRSIVEKGARAAIIDITGIQVMDTGTADHFLRMAKAVRLLGAECVLTGINPGIAQTMVHMGVDLSDVITHRSLRDALQHSIGEHGIPFGDGARGANRAHAARHSDGG
jgi:rsbT co-antagonist protein RsbR